MPAEDAIFRGAMRLLASGVTIVATNCRGEYSGLTATAVCSLALSPARILASVNRAGRTYERIVESRIMSVNLLAEDHAPLADRFAGRTGAAGEDRFAHAAWEERVTGAPLLGNALTLHLGFRAPAGLEDELTLCLEDLRTRHSGAGHEHDERHVF